MASRCGGSSANPRTAATRNVQRILTILNDCGARATFFTLGWVAERYPQLVREIVSQGHELASHGFAHHRASDQEETAFYGDIAHAKLKERLDRGADRGGFVARERKVDRNDVGTLIEDLIVSLP